MSAGTVAGMLVWMPINSGGACRAICSVTAFPQSPPCATNRVYPRRFISTIQARAMRMGSQPVVVGLPENPWPGSDGITTIERVRLRSRHGPWDWSADR